MRPDHESAHQLVDAVVKVGVSSEDLHPGIATEVQSNYVVVLALQNQIRAVGSLELTLRCEFEIHVNLVRLPNLSFRRDQSDRAVVEHEHALSVG